METRFRFSNAVELRFGGSSSQPEELRQIRLEEFCHELEINTYEKLSVIRLHGFKIKEYEKIFKILKNKPIKKLSIEYTSLYKIRNFDCKSYEHELALLIIDFLETNNTIEEMYFSQNYHRNEKLSLLTTYGRKFIDTLTRNTSLTEFVWNGLDYPYYEICERNEKIQKIRKMSLQFKCWKLIKDDEEKCKLLPQFVVSHYKKIFVDTRF